MTQNQRSLGLSYYSRAKVGREPILRSSFCIAQWSVGVDCRGPGRREVQNSFFSAVMEIYVEIDPFGSFSS